MSKLKEPTPIKNNKIEAKKFCKEEIEENGKVKIWCVDSGEMSPVEEVLNWAPTQLESPTEIINISSPPNLELENDNLEGRKWAYEHQQDLYMQANDQEIRNEAEGFEGHPDIILYDHNLSQFESAERRYNVSLNILKIWSWPGFIGTKTTRKQCFTPETHKFRWEIQEWKCTGKTKERQKL